MQERNSEATGQGMGSGARCTVIAAVAMGACGVTANLDHTNTVTKHDGRSAKALTAVSGCLLIAKVFVVTRRNCNTNIASAA